MTDNITAEVIAIGTELLLGEITDTNSVYLARQLRNLGMNLFYMTTVGDNQQRIADAIRLAFSRADVVITCGGLGPTVDDMTRQSVADATERDLVFQQALYDQIAARFATYKVTMTSNNNRQAYLPADAIAIENPVGTAPSFIVEHGHNTVISLPGVPREMKYLFETRVIAYLRDKYDLGIIKARILKTAGIGESTLDDLLGDEILNHANPSIGLAAHHGIIDIRMTAKADTEAAADTMLDQMERRVRERVQEVIFGTQDDDLATVLIALLQGRDAQIAIYEAGITGAVSQQLATHSQAAAIIANTTIHDDPQAAYDEFSMTPDHNLRELALHIAPIIADRHAAQASIVILSQPDVYENQDIEMATVVVTHTPQSTQSRIYGFGAQNPLTSQWVSRWALASIWRSLKK